MEYTELTKDDWRLFLSWAVAENWQVPLFEQRLFQEQWYSYFFALRSNGAVRGFASAVPYPESGWIGNLLVDPECRGQGYGSTLFDFALDFLRQQRVPRIWLTASESGLPLYQRRGFVAIDRVERWQGRGLGGQEVQSSPALEELTSLDRFCWGESREPLLAAVAAEGESCRSGETLALLQPGLPHWQLGPWLSPERCPRENRLVLTMALEKTPADRLLVVDLLASSEMGMLLRSAGFVKTGSNELMCLAEQEVPRLGGVVALASLGSIG